MEERRIHHRAQFQGKVECSEKAEIKAYDISLSGIGIESNRNLQEGTVVFLLITLNAKGIIKVIGRVAWTTEHTHNAYKCGVEFFSLTNYEQTKIKEYIEDHHIDN
ncbi:MAG: PilZ domain-containing protein [Spirochaetales bacterium]|nr:PilZ domain-containing protein [Spirochaetales bacterium]